MAEALFVPDGGHLVPTEAARGPWTPDALHGGPVAALVARAAESCEADPAMHVARLSIDLLRPVPLVPLTVTATLVRPGRKVQLVDVRVADARRDLVWGRGLRIRTHAPGTSEGAGLPEAGAGGPVPGRDPGAPPGPGTGHRSPEPMGHYRAFHNTGAELRFAVGHFDRQGPAATWIRLAVPVVAGEEPTPLQRVAAAADFGNGISSVLDFARYVFINPDLTIYLDRPASGEWVCLDAATALGSPGVGLAQSALWDGRGPIGRALQGLVVERRA